MIIDNVIVSEKSDAPCPRPPSLENQSEPQWNTHAHVAYFFARHARHDIANIDAVLGMLEAVQKMAASGTSNKPPPPELAPEVVRQKIHLSVRKLASTANDMVLLSQAANRAGYGPVRAMALRDLLHEAIAMRLKGQEMPHGLLEAAGDLQVGVLNDNIISAIAALYFQWTPWYHPHVKALGASLKRGDDHVQFGFPADDAETVASFARRLQLPPMVRVPSVVEHALSINTAELAIWMARFVIEIHGGYVEADPNDPDLTLRVTLPLM